MKTVFDAGPEELQRAPLCMVVAGRIRDAILSGELEEGAALPGEKDLATRLGVGRSTVREAVRVLQAQGLISGGDTVSTRTPVVRGGGTVPSAANALENLLVIGQVPLADLVALRRVIERAGFQAASERRDPEALAVALRALAAMSAARDDVEAFLQADVDFHTAIIDAAGNQAFSLVMRVLRDATAGHLRDALARESDLQAVTGRLIQEHKELLDAIVKGNGDAAAAHVDTHIVGFYESKA